MKKEQHDEDKELIEIAKRGLHFGKVNIKKERAEMYGKYKKKI